MSELASQLTQATLADVHASWIPEMDVALLARAKNSDYGLRWLASRLAKVEMFSVPPAALDIAAELLQANAWWAMSISESSAWLIELGAYTRISSIRLAIMRVQVLQWRRVLGAALYQKMLREEVSNFPSEKEFYFDDDFSLGWIDDAALTQSLMKCAYQELLGFASRQHPLLVQRVALAFPETWWQSFQRNPPMPVLDHGTVMKILAR